MSISTGAPQGCVLSPFLFTMYTNSCRSVYSNNHYFKYADDTAVVGLLSDNETDYRSDIDHFVSWCVANCLELNVVKTKELVIDFRSDVHHPTPVNINGQHIEIVHSYKYLGTTIDDKLRWDDNTMNLYKKGQQRLYFLRKLNALHIDRNILFVFHDSFVKSVMRFGLVCWWGNRYVLYTRYQSGAIVQVKNTANGNQNLISPHPLLTRPLRPSPLWKEVQNANSKNPASH